jgi:CBS domain-containing protein
VSALAICNKAGELVDNISATDLRGLERDDIPNILEPVGHFFLSHGIQRKPTITTPLWDTTLEECLTLLVKNNVHRVWIVGHAKNPVGVVSLTDICGVFNSH